MKKNKRTMDLTAGNPLVQIFLFSLPLGFGTLFQQLYSFADTVIVGRFLGVSALGAVGSTYSLHFLTLGFVQGACIGFGIPIAQSFGAKNRDDIHRYLWNGMWLCLMMALLLTVVMFFAAAPLLQLVHTPDDLFPMALTYIRIIFLGIPTSILYNYSASALRAFGDSRHPFYFLLISSLLNILLDYLLIVHFHMGVDGAAWATVLSQLISGLLNTWWLLSKIELIEIRRTDFALSRFHIRQLCVIGLPMGFEYSVSAIGAVIMQNAINLLGSVAVAAQTAGEKIRQMFTLPMESVGMAMATYAGQNYGAGRIDRIKSGIKNGLLIQGIYCIFAWIVIFFCKGWFVELVLGSKSGEVSALAIQYLAIISTLFIFHGALMIFRNVLQGLGYSIQAILSGIGELIGRSIGGWLAVSFFGYTAICYSNPLAWALALFYCVWMVTRILKKIQTKQ